MYQLSRPLTRLLAGVSAGVVALGLATAAAPADAAAKPSTRKTSWTAAPQATIRPGTMMYTKGAQCTANFVFTDAKGGVYVGYAAHCAGLGEATDTNGCDQDSVPLGTAVAFRRGGNLATEGTAVGSGTLAYSSWRTMRRIGTTAANTCAYNDFALVKVSAKDVSKVNPTVPIWGGPTGIDTDGTEVGDQVYSIGNSSLRAGLRPLRPKTGSSLGTSGGGWTHQLYTVTPGIPGDSGSGFMTAGGKAIGTLSTLGLAPAPASNNIGDLRKELTFAQQHSGIPGLKLALGTRGFSADLGDQG